MRLTEPERGTLEVVGCDRRKTGANEFSIGFSDACLTASEALLEHPSLTAARHRGEYGGAAIASILSGVGCPAADNGSNNPSADAERQPSESERWQPAHTATLRPTHGVVTSVGARVPIAVRLTDGELGFIDG